MLDSDLSPMFQLAYLNEDTSLQADLHLIMNFMAQLKEVDTKGISPLFHPSDLLQRLRQDQISEDNVIPELAAIAPQFEDGLYLVPKLIEG